ncbi:VWA domain-containing protein [Pelagibius sp. Alg239-R121]|uniref:vWA domain-containing protein n=1 Tax=Pelagibius sp. Alg239-R121 TaxID=2993448 RepID=UPI0024A73C57|nr:VWA domain-containing protein [Pelagibius sp. Alg239-R121]
MASAQNIPALPVLSDPLLRLVRFLRMLRDNGYVVGAAEAHDAARFLDGDEMLSADELRQGLRSLLCTTTADWRRFDEMFDAFWLRRGLKRVATVSGSGPQGLRRLPGSGPATKPSVLAAAVERSAADGGEQAGPAGTRQRGASAAESLEKADLRQISDPEELARVHELTARLAARMRSRLSRRERERRKGRRIDLRKTIHRNIAHGGTPIELFRRQRRDKPLRIVVLLDVSGSMNHYSLFFLRFILGVLDNFRQAEAFVFHTRLVHISEALKERNAEKALERMTLISQGWSGGTKIGESLDAFNRLHAQRVLNSRSVVMVVSDGYDTGSSDKLGESLIKLRRRCKRIVWLNPMIGWSGYEPVAGGMAAALPHIDLFAPAHNLESLAALEPYLAKL